MFGWILKMLLKVAKPFVGVAVFAFLIDAIESYLGNKNQEGDGTEDDLGGDAEADE